MSRSISFPDAKELFPMLKPVLYLNQLFAMDINILSMSNITNFDDKKACDDYLTSRRIRLHEIWKELDNDIAKKLENGMITGFPQDRIILGRVSCDGHMNLIAFDYFEELDDAVNYQLRHSASVNKLIEETTCPKIFPNLRQVLRDEWAVIICLIIAFIFLKADLNFSSVAEVINSFIAEHILLWLVFLAVLVLGGFIYFFVFFALFVSDLFSGIKNIFTIINSIFSGISRYNSWKQHSPEKVNELAMGLYRRYRYYELWAKTDLDGHDKANIYAQRFKGQLNDYLSKHDYETI